MSPIPYFDQTSCRKYVILRPLGEDTLNILKSLGYDFLELFTPSPKLVQVLKLANEESSEKLIHDSKLKELGVSANHLVGLNGIRLKDANDILKNLSTDEKLNDSDLMNILIELICLEAPEKEVIAAEELKMISTETSKIIENSVCTIFGSYPSQVRRNGFSDIDLAVSATPTKSTEIRPLQTIIDYPQGLFEKPMNYAEFYSYSDAEIIKAMYNCFVLNEEFRERFQMRANLAETPIVMLKSTKIPDMDMSYDISVNNQISIEKAQILNDFIVADKSEGNKMRNLAMFVTHWAKSNKLLGGAYPDEKLVIKYRFNSYVMNYLIIHFVQIAAKTCIVNIQEKPENRVSSYNFDNIFASHADFLERFFQYYLAIDYENMGIFGMELFGKEVLAESKGVKVSAFMMVDSLHTTHNLTGLINSDGVRFFKDLLGASLEKMKNSSFRITDLLQ